MDPVVPSAGPVATSRAAADEPTRVSADLAAEAAAPDLEGARIEGYQLCEEIHRGGQGVVYRAIQLGTKRQVALKVLLEGPFAAESARRRFEREVELAASLRHPNIVTILDSGSSHGRYYFAMEYIDGLRLDRHLAKVRPSLRDTLRLFATICSAVNFAHQRGVIHRDLKPPNLLVDADGQPHVLDFGLAKPIHPPTADDPTVQVLSTAGELLGTVAYMSPEQTLGAADVDVRSDVYSLGVVFYEALLGRLPYAVEGPLGEVLTRIAQSDPERPRALRHQSRFGHMINDELETILLKALEKAPARRYQTAGELARDLEHLLRGEPIEAKRASGLYMLRKTLKRYRLQATTGAAVLLTMIVALMGFAFLYSSERDAREQAQKDRWASQQHAIDARRARDQLKQALVQQTIQRGDLAQARGDLVAARDFYWEAYDASGGPAARWALRQYYLHTGDDGAQVLLLAGHGPMALSPNVRLAAVCETPDAITVRDVSRGVTVAWRHAPGPVLTLSIANDGTVAAAGKGWAQLWRADAQIPEVAGEFVDELRVAAVFGVSGARRLLVVSPTRLLCLEGPAGRVAGSAALRAAAIGGADYSSTLDQLAVPTSVGVHWVAIRADGTLSMREVGLEDATVRQVRLTDERLLAATASTVYAAPLTPEGPGAWVRAGETLGDWEWFDASRERDTLVFGARDGRVAVYRNAEHEQTWRITQGDLADLRLSEDGSTVMTLDQRGTLTRWLPPLGRQADGRILTRALTGWGCAEDGSSVLLLDDRERVTAYSPQRANPSDTFSAKAPLGLPRLRAGGECLLAVSRGGARAVVCTGNAVRLRDADTRSAVLVLWDDVEFSVLKQAAISGDGRVVVLVGQTPAGDRQQISFWNWEAGALEGRPQTLAQLLAPQRPPQVLVGSAIRQIAFQPQAARVLVARSNGDLLWLDAAGAPESGATDSVAPRPPRAWHHLESPPTGVAFDRLGEQLAVACEDGFVRLVDPRGGELQPRIRLGAPVRMLSFDPRGGVLLIATADGAIGLYELLGGERVAQLAARGSGNPGFATWVGTADAEALLLATADGVEEHPYGDTDARIDRNRAYARSHAVARYLASAEFEAAWDAVASLRQLSPALAREAEEAILAEILRRPGPNVPQAWIDAALSSATPPTLLRLGHAAYDGEHFELARDCLRRGSAASAVGVDAQTALRVAQCDYLAGDYALAATGFAELLERPDLDTPSLPTVQLQHVAALVAAGHLDQARAITRRVGTLRRDAPRNDPIATASARDIARLLTEAQTESLVGEGLLAASSALLRQFAESSLSVQDDALFFNGELARLRGDLGPAAMQYQACIDLARDTWPSNWARYRLSRLSAGPQ